MPKPRRGIVWDVPWRGREEVMESLVEAIEDGVW